MPFSFTPHLPLLGTGLKSKVRSAVNPVGVPPQTPFTGLRTHPPAAEGVVANISQLPLSMENWAKLNGSCQGGVAARTPRLWPTTEMGGQKTSPLHQVKRGYNSVVQFLHESPHGIRLKLTPAETTSLLCSFPAPS